MMGHGVVIQEPLDLRAGRGRGRWAWSQWTSAQWRCSVFKAHPGDALALPPTPRAVGRSNRGSSRIAEPTAKVSTSVMSPTTSKSMVRIVPSGGDFDTDRRPRSAGRPAEDMGRLSDWRRGGPCPLPRYG